MYSKKYIDVITLALVVIILILMNIYQFQIQSKVEKILNQNQIQNTQNVLENGSNKQVELNNIVEEDFVETEPSVVEVEPSVIEAEPSVIEAAIELEKVYPEDWYIAIPSIDLIAPINQGTTTEVLNKSVGHFEESPLLNGNVCLAAHNRGYNVNYFEKLKKLLLNDIIIYQYGDIEKSYSVSNVTIIKETDWSYIEESSNENKITLITCVENEPEYRLCVQATEIK